MKKLLVALSLLFATPAWADSITIGLSGSSLTGLTSNPSMSYALSDTDLTNLISWATQAFAPCLQTNFNTGPLSSPLASATNPQVLQCWISVLLYEGTVSAVQRFMTQPPSTPAAIGLTPGTGAASH